MKRRIQSQFTVLPLDKEIFKELGENWVYKAPLISRVKDKGPDYDQLPVITRQKILHRLNMLFIAVTKSWTKAINVAGDTAPAAIYPPGYQPVAPPQVIYQDRPITISPRGRGTGR
uniref:Uncharacterized protein n=1 Tax=Timema monikensis TaxID=170555 RepID=A0A7R9DZW2_9NEOP|nr:unnamed protein product [Timema monikensis]